MIDLKNISQSCSASLKKNQEKRFKRTQKKAFDELIEKMNKKQLIEIVKHQVEIIEHEEKKNQKLINLKKLKNLKKAIQS
ncbi:hypothetical protein ACA758_01960 [Mycoplasmopsis agassizii]|uniref:hypothetical protein n=1 Tax=Mycoplasmopsis agassizii TaxID=33922 RepID=UPI0035274996